MRVNRRPMAIVILLLVFAGCSKTIKFPVSDELPAADVVATVKKDKSDNYDIKVEADYLAEPGRLSPPKSYYVVWLQSEDNQQQNLGILEIDSNKQAELEAISPFKPFRIFITAEEAGDVKRPGIHLVFRSEEIKM